MNSILQNLFRYKAWANDELLTALSNLGAPFPLTDLVIKALTHTYVVDRIFAAHMEGRDHGFTSSNLSPMPTLRDLSIEMRNSDRRYVDYVSTLKNEQLLEQIDFTFTDGAPGRMSREEMLMHVLTHGVGHRGQISALLLLNSITPVKDGFTTYLHNTEAIARRRNAA
jgi:uncharacterized damage-inducible protein DinB